MGGSKICDSLWQGEGGQKSSKKRDILYGRPHKTTKKLPRKTVKYAVVLCFPLILRSEVANRLSNSMICIFSWIGTYSHNVLYVLFKI